MARNLKEYNYFPLVGSKHDTDYKFEWGHFLRYWSFGYLHNSWKAARANRRIRRARKLYGSSPADAWSFDHFLLATIYNGLTTLAKDSHGYPTRHDEHGEPILGEEDGYEKWIAELNRVAGLAKTIIDRWEERNPYSTCNGKEELERFRDWHFTRESECKALTIELFAWLGKNLYFLWD